jgi:hypothetical protein
MYDVIFRYELYLSHGVSHSFQYISQTYEEVCGGHTGHTEAVRLIFDPAIVSFSELLIVFWDRINPTTLNKQGNDIGSQYRSGKHNVLLYPYLKYPRFRHCYYPLLDFFHKRK